MLSYKSVNLNNFRKFIDLVNKVDFSNKKEYQNAYEYVTSALDYCVNKNNQLGQAQANVVAAVLTKLIASEMKLDVNVDFDLNQSSTVPACYFPQTRTICFYYFNNQIQKNNICAELVRTFNALNVASNDREKYEDYAWLLQSIGHELRHAIQDDYLNKRIHITPDKDSEYILNEVIREYKTVIHKHANILYNKYHDNFLFEREADFFGFRCFCDKANKFLNSPHYSTVLRQFRLYEFNQNRYLIDQGYSNIIERIYLESFKWAYESARSTADKRNVLNNFANEVSVNLDRVLKQREIDELLENYPELKKVFSSNGEIKDLTYFMLQYSRNLEVLEHSRDKGKGKIEEVKQDFNKNLNKFLLENELARHTYNMFKSIKSNKISQTTLDEIRNYLAQSEDNAMFLKISIDKFTDLMLKEFIYTIDINERQKFYHDYGWFCEAVFDEDADIKEINESLNEMNKALYKENVFEQRKR